MRLGASPPLFTQILPVIAWLMLVPGVAPGDSDFPNELNSPVDEPKIILPDVSEAGRIPARSVATRTIESTDPVVKLVFETRDAQRRRLLSTAEHTPWQIMHGLLALRHDFLIRDGDQVVSGLDWVSAGPKFRGEHWFEKTAIGGRAHPYSVPYAFEGHINQFLAILSMTGLPLDHEFGTADAPITMRDLLRNAQMTVNEKEEITWTLWALSRYLPPDAQWKNDRGEVWSIERLVRLQIDKPLQGSPCGGTHGLFALAHARNVYLRKGQPLRGVWLEGENKIRRYIQTARNQQNPNGTLSSNFFRGRDYKQDFDKRMASAGHILEFLMLALPHEELSETWVRRAIEATCRDLMDNRHEYVSCSPLYHTVNALSIYLERVAPGTPAGGGSVAEADGKARPISQQKSLSPRPEPKTVDRGAGTTQPENPVAPAEPASTPAAETHGLNETSQDSDTEGKNSRPSAAQAVDGTRAIESAAPGRALETLPASPEATDPDQTAATPSIERASPMVPAAEPQTPPRSHGTAAPCGPTGSPGNAPAGKPDPQDEQPPHPDQHRWKATPPERRRMIRAGKSAV